MQRYRLRKDFRIGDSFKIYVINFTCGPRKTIEEADNKTAYTRRVVECLPTALGDLRIAI